MSISLLRTLIAISERGSFKAAADQICVSHAAIGQQMKRLEDTLQVELFDRSRRTPRLNQRGKALVPRAREVVSAYDNMVAELTGVDHLTGELTLGAVPSAIRGLIPDAIKKLLKNYPDLHIRVVPGLSGELLEQVDRGALDAAVMARPADVGLQLSWQPVADEELVLLTSPAISDGDPLRVLREMPFIRHTRRAAVGQLADQWLAGNGIEVRTSMEMESLESLSSMISYNLGVSIVPNLCVQDPIFASLRKIALPGKPMRRALGVLAQAGCPRMNLVNRLHAQLLATVAEHAELNQIT